MNYLGNIAEDATIRGSFNTRGSAGAPITLAGTPVLSVYKDAGTTESTAGVTLTVDFDSQTGFHIFTIDTSADAFYATGSNYQIVITTGTVDGTSVVGVCVGSFSIENRYAPSGSGPTVAEFNARSLPSADYFVVGDYTAPPTASANASQVRTELTTELGRIDANISSRSTFAGGAVASVTNPVTVGTNNDKTGYSLTATTGLGNQTANITGTMTTVTNLTNAPTSGDLTAAMKASVNIEVDAALADIHLDHLLAVDYDPASKPGVSTALLNELVESDGGVSRYTANALEQGPTGGGGVADWTSDERTAIRSILGIPGSGTTPTDPTTGIMDTIRDLVVAVDVVADAIEVDTQNIQSRLPAALVSGRIDSSVGAMKANVITASSIASDAITDEKVASDVTIASVTGSVGSVDTVTNPVTVGTNNDKTGYALFQAFPTNFASLSINASGHISRVVLCDTTTANTDMRGTDNALLASGYTAPANSDITAIKAKTDQFVFTVANQVDANALTGGGGGGGGIAVNVLPAVGIVADRSPAATITPVIGETISQSITLYATDGTTPINLSGKTLAIVFETLQGVDVAVVGSGNITISGTSNNVVGFAYPSAVTASERTLRFAIRDAAAPLTMYLQGLCIVTRAPQVDL